MTDSTTFITFYEKRRVAVFCNEYDNIFFYKYQNKDKSFQNNLLVKGKLTVILDKNPFGGCLTNGIDSDGVMVIVVPGGSANLPSFVIQSILFCRECGMFSLATPSWLFSEAIGSKAANAMLNITRGTDASIAYLRKISH